MDLFITGSRQTLWDRATRWEQRAPGKEKEWKQSQNLINRVPIPANLEWNYQGDATGIFNSLRWEKNLKGNSSRSMNRENMIYTTVQCASNIQYQKEYAWPVGRGAASCTILHLPVIPCYRTLLKAIQNQGIKFFFNGLSLTRHASAPMLRGLCRKRSLGLDLECVHPGALLYEYSSTCICFYTLYSTRQGGALLYGRLWRGPVRCAVESALLLKPPLCLSIIPVWFVRTKTCTRLNKKCYVAGLL